MAEQSNKLFLREIGKRIAQERKKQNLTQEILAEKADVTTQFVSYAESGKRSMRAENLYKMSISLGVSVDYLLTGDIVDKDKLLLEEKLNQLTPTQFHFIESIVDDCICLNEANKNLKEKSDKKDSGSQF